MRTGEGTARLRLPARAGSWTVRSGDHDAPGLSFGLASNIRLWVLSWPGGSGDHLSILLG